VQTDVSAIEGLVPQIAGASQRLSALEQTRSQASSSYTADPSADAQAMRRSEQLAAEARQLEQELVGLKQELGQHVQRVQEACTAIEALVRDHQHNAELAQRQAAQNPALRTAAVEARAEKRRRAQQLEQLRAVLAKGRQALSAGPEPGVSTASPSVHGTAGLEDIIAEASQSPVARARGSYTGFPASYRSTAAARSTYFPDAPAGRYTVSSGYGAGRRSGAQSYQTLTGGMDW
jgi:hypothetical protein